jgi:hypothetical protein
VLLPLSNQKNVKKLPIEFKRGFTIFYATNIDQLYNVCFNTPESTTDYSHLEDLGVVVEVYEHDSMMEEILNHEQIHDVNLIDGLK